MKYLLLHHHFFLVTATLFVSTPAGTFAKAETVVGGFSGTTGVERVEQVVSRQPPVWREGTGYRLVVSGCFIQTEVGEGSVFVRMFDEKRPLVLMWHGATGFQWVAPGELPENVPETPMLSDPQSVAWRLRVHALQAPEQRLVLEVRQANGSWWRFRGKAVC